MSVLRRVEVAEARGIVPQALDPDTLAQAGAIVQEVRERGEEALREHAERLGDLRANEPLVYDRTDLQRALEGLPAEQQALLGRVAERIRSFALAQLEALVEVDLEIPPGRAGHSVVPVETAGCYAPGGRFPLPSSVLMTAVTARVAKVPHVWVASPKPAAVVLAAAAVAEADALLAAGGAQAIAALAYGAGPIPACDVIVGPGNRYVTAAKQLVYGRVGIDMLAGPSELVVIADASAPPEVVAADLLAQAEHDEDAFAALIALDEGLAEAVQQSLASQLASLPTAQTARAALKRGWCVVVERLAQAAELANRLAPEHLEVQISQPEALLPQLRHYGALFVGHAAAEVFADYGSGPNHVLPTGGTARHCGGLSVMTFLRVRTWMRAHEAAIDKNDPLVEDVAQLARLEGLEAHARAAEIRRS